jgi:hypothetical protein
VRGFLDVQLTLTRQKKKPDTFEDDEFTGQWRKFSEKTESYWKN